MKLRRIAVIALLGSIGAASIHVLRTHRRQSGDLETLKDAYARAGDAGRRRAVLAHASTATAAGVAGWLADVAERDHAVANQAASTLGALADKGAAAELAAIVTGQASTLVRSNAARALGRCGGPLESPVLAAAIGDPNQPLRVRQEAALALGEIGDASTVPALIATIERTAGEASPEGEQLRISLLQALGEIRSNDARRFLGEYARRDLSATERAFVIRAVGQGS